MSYIALMNHELLSPAEERTLLRAAQTGDDDARERLILCNLRLVHSIAETYTRYAECVETEDVIADGVIGICTAIDKFDLNLPYRFSTYCVWHIRSALGRSDFFNAHVRLPEYVREDIRKVTKARAAFLQTFGVSPTTEHLADETGIAEEKVIALDEIRDASHTVQSLYAPVIDDGDGDELALIDVLPDENADLDIQRLEREQEVEFFLSHLNELERRLIELRWGLTATNYGQRLSWKAVYRELYGNARGKDISRQRLHPNDMPAFHDAIIDKLQRLATSVKRGEMPGPANVQAIMTAPGEQMTLGI